MKLALLVLVACGGKPPDDSLALEPYLKQLATLDADKRSDVIAGWKLTPDEWRRTVVSPYDTAYAGYARHFDEIATQIASSLEAHPNAARVERSYADRPGAGRGEKRARWALPVLAEAYVATIVAGTSAGVAFVRVDGKWKLLAVDELVRDAITSRDPSCNELIHVALKKSCDEIAWEIAEAALRNQPERFAHACTLAKTACGKPAP